MTSTKKILLLLLLLLLLRTERVVCTQYYSTGRGRLCGIDGGDAGGGRTRTKRWPVAANTYEPVTCWDWTRTWVVEGWWCRCSPPDLRDRRSRWSGVIGKRTRATACQRGPISIADGPPYDRRCRTMALPIVGGRGELGPPLVPYTAQIILYYDQASGLAIAYFYGWFMLWFCLLHDQLWNFKVLFFAFFKDFSKKCLFLVVLVIFLFFWPVFFLLFCGFILQSCFW